MIEITQFIFWIHRLYQTRLHFQVVLIFQSVLRLIVFPTLTQVFYRLEEYMVLR